MLFAVVPLVDFSILIAHVADIMLALQASYGFVPIFGTLLGNLLSMHALTSEDW